MRVAYCACLCWLLACGSSVETQTSDALGSEGSSPSTSDDGASSSQTDEASPGADESSEADSASSSASSSDDADDSVTTATDGASEADANDGALGSADAPPDDSVSDDSVSDASTSDDGADGEPDDGVSDDSSAQSEAPPPADNPSECPESAPGDGDACATASALECRYAESVCACPDASSTTVGRPTGSGGGRPNGGTAPGSSEEIRVWSCVTSEESTASDPSATTPTPTGEQWDAAWAVMRTKCATAGCHMNGVGNLLLDPDDAALSLANASARAPQVDEQVSTGSMPPRGQDALTADEVDAITAWVASL